MGKSSLNPLVSEQVLILQQITEKLRASYNGLDVQWIQEPGIYIYESHFFFREAIYSH
jgi:hypothetical protein